MKKSLFLWKYIDVFFLKIMALPGYLFVKIIKKKIEIRIPVTVNDNILSPEK